MCDGFLVLAQAPAGLTCLLMPRRLADGDRNAFRLMRLKDKLGDWANASSEVEFCGAQAWRVGEEGRGVATIIGMVMMTGWTACWALRRKCAWRWHRRCTTHGIDAPLESR